MISLLDQLDRVAAYDGPWRPLRNERELLRERVSELRSREERLDDLLVVALVGGSGVGKSTLLNALAGDQLAATSEMRPCTSVPTVYHPPGTAIRFDGWSHKAGSALERMILIDTPDSDSVMREHRNKVVEALQRCDLILVCGSPEKYLDEATWALLRPLQGERIMACVETKACGAESGIREHWSARLREQGFDITHYFRVSARRALDRKLLDRAPQPDEFEFGLLERFLRDELNRERIHRIKRSNALGLLTKTLRGLRERIVARAPALNALYAAISEAESDTLAATAQHIREYVFAEPHLWNHALGREISVRAKGFIGSIYRMFETIRALPVRLAAWSPWLGARGMAGRQAASMLSGATLLDEHTRLVSDAVRRRYLDKHSELSLRMAQADFEAPDRDASAMTFVNAVEDRVGALLQGPARDRIVARARVVTSWPVTILADAAPLAFVVFTAYRILRDYFSMQLLSGAFFLYSAAVLAIIVGIELTLLSLAVRVCAWSARRRTLRDITVALAAGAAAFQPERDVVAAARTTVDALAALCGENP